MRECVCWSWEGHLGGYPSNLTVHPLYLSIPTALYNKFIPSWDSPSKVLVVSFGGKTYKRKVRETDYRPHCWNWFSSCNWHLSSRVGERVAPQRWFAYKWLFSLRDGALSRTQRWSPLLVDWIFSSEVGRSALMIESLCCWGHKWPPFLVLCIFYWQTHSDSSRVADDRGWLISAGQVILDVCLFGASSVVNAFWWVLRCDTMIFPLYAHLHTSIYMPLYSRLPCSWYSNLSLFRTLSNQPSQLTSAHESILILGHCFHTKWMIRCSTQSSPHWEDFLSPLIQCYSISFWLHVPHGPSMRPFLPRSAGHKGPSLVNIDMSWGRSPCSTVRGDKGSQTPASAVYLCALLLLVPKPNILLSSCNGLLLDLPVLVT